MKLPNKRRTADRTAEGGTQERHRRNGFQEDRAAAGHGRSFAAFAASSITARSASMNFPVAVLWMLWPPSTNSRTFTEGRRFCISRMPSGPSQSVTVPPNAVGPATHK